MNDNWWETSYDKILESINLKNKKENDIDSIISEDKTAETIENENDKKIKIQAKGKRIDKDSNLIKKKRKRDIRLIDIED